MPPGLSSPACAAIVQQFFTGNGASSPATKSRRRRRGSGRAKHASIVSINASNTSEHR
jgi:excinuclease ABC subunit A